MLRIQLTPDFDEDREALDDPTLIRIVDLLIRDLADGIHVIRKPLGNVKGVADLRGCWGVKFDKLGFDNRFRLVFRYLPSDFAPEVILFLSVGPRFGHWVYRRAGMSISKF